ncbi:MAG TPA: ATP-binding protein [Sediminibacterium sp.]|nr:ATP-binding protein [Sediminibacterium sp.]
MNLSWSPDTNFKASAADRKTVDSLNQLSQQLKPGDIAHTLNDLFVAENLANASGYNQGLALAYLLQGNIFQQRGYGKRALSVYYKSLDLFRSLKDSFYIAVLSQHIATSLRKDLKPDQALTLLNQSLAVFERLKKQESIVQVQIDIGSVYLENRRLDKAVVFFEKALSLAKANGNLQGEKKAFYYLGLLAEKDGKTTEAAEWYHRSLHLDTLLDDRYEMALNQLQLAALFKQKNDRETTIRENIHAYQNARMVSAFQLQQTAANSLISSYREAGDVNKASQWQDSLIAVLRNQNENEKEYALNFIDVIRNQDTRNSNTEKEVERQRQVQREQLLIITIGTFVLIILAVLAVLALVNYQRQRFFGRELKQKNEIIEKNSASLDQLNKEISHQNALLEEDNKTKNKLLSIISHDLRTPLVNTKGVLNLVNQGMVPPEEADRLLQLLETQYLGTTSLLDNMLFWIKGQMDGKEDEKVKVGLYHLIRSLEEEQRLPLVKKKIQLINKIDRSVSLMVQKEMMRIVCRNLISNAVKFTNEGGWIEISSHPDDTGKYLYLTVRDSGIGMTPEMIEKVNAKQYYNTAGTSFEKGSGFGLMLCRDLIEKNGGSLLIESEPGKGSAFTIKVPTA